GLHFLLGARGASGLDEVAQHTEAGSDRIHDRDLRAVGNAGGRETDTANGNTGGGLEILRRQRAACAEHHHKTDRPHPLQRHAAPAKCRHSSLITGAAAKNGARLSPAELHTPYITVEGLSGPVCDKTTKCRHPAARSTGGSTLHWQAAARHSAD